MDNLTVILLTLHYRSKPVEKVNRLKHPKAQSAGTATTSKAQPTLTDTTNTTAPGEDEVKVENISPDTSPSHQSTNKPSDVTVLDKTFNKTKQDGKDSSENSRSIRRAESNREKDRITQKKKETEATGKKTAPVQKDKTKEPTGYAARYFQKRAAAAEHSTNTKPMDKEILTAGIIDVDRPLLSPATRESMARKRRCTDKPMTDDGSQNTSVTSISAPVRRTKPSSLASGEASLWILCVPIGDLACYNQPCERRLH